jgi:hypothetical protein
MLPQFFTALGAAMGLTKENVSLFLRVGWVIIVSSHIAYVCGWLAFVGLTVGQPFARAADIQEIQRTMRVSARISLQTEIRAQARAYCVLTDEQARDVVRERIERLRLELLEIEPKAEIPIVICQ